MDSDQIAMVLSLGFLFGMPVVAVGGMLLIRRGQRRRRAERYGADGDGMSPWTAGGAIGLNGGLGGSGGGHHHGGGCGGGPGCGGGGCGGGGNGGGC